MSLLQIYLPRELFIECKQANNDFILNAQTYSEDSKLFIKNYQKMPSTNTYSSLFVYLNKTSENEYDLKITVKNQKFKIENNNGKLNFKNHLILIYKRNQYELINKKQANENLVASESQNQLIQEKIRNKVAE